MLGSLFVGFSQFPPQLRAKSSSPTPSSQCYRFPGKAHCQEKAKAHPGSGLWPIGIGVGQRLQVRLLKGSALARNPAHICGSRVNISLKSIYFNRKGPSQDTGAQHFRNTRSTYPPQQTGYSSIGRASDCRVLQQSDGPWFDSGWPDFLTFSAPQQFEAIAAPALLVALGLLTLATPELFIARWHSEPIAKWGPRTSNCMMQPRYLG